VKKKKVEIQSRLPSTITDKKRDVTGYRWERKKTEDAHGISA